MICLGKHPFNCLHVEQRYTFSSPKSFPQRSASVGMPLCQPEHAYLMPIMCYSKKTCNSQPGHPTPAGHLASWQFDSQNPSVKGTELLCKPQYKPSVSQLTTGGTALPKGSSGPGGMFRTHGQTCQCLSPKPKQQDPSPGR